VKQVSKLDITNSIARRLKGAVSRCHVYDAVTAILYYIEEKVLEEQPIIVKNFGTISVSTRKAHIRNRRNKLSWIRERKFITFYPHLSFRRLVKRSQTSFKKSKLLAPNRKKTLKGVDKK
jgi:nucleoid DNA-binding protein